MNRINKQSIHKFFSKESQPAQSNTETNIKDSLTKLLARAEREVPEYGEFRAVKESFTNKDTNFKIGDITFEISPPLNKSSKNQTTRMLKIKAYEQLGRNNSEALFKSGNKKEILEYLQKTDLAQEIQEFIKKVSKSL